METEERVSLNDLNTYITCYMVKTTECGTGGYIVITRKEVDDKR